MKKLIILSLLLCLFHSINAMDFWEQRGPQPEKEKKAYVKHVFNGDYVYSLMWKSCAPSSAKLAVFKEKLVEMAQENNSEGIEAIFDLAKESEFLETSEQIKQLKLYAALFHAVNHGNYEATKCLLEKRLINLQSNPNNLLHIVCYLRWHENEANTIDVINRMLQLGANINKKDKQNRTPLDIACGYRDPYTLQYRDAAPKSVQEFLIKHDAKKTKAEAKPAAQIPSADTQASRPCSDWGHPLYEPIRGDFFSTAEQRRSELSIDIDKLMDKLMNELGS